MIENSRTAGHIQAVISVLFFTTLVIMANNSMDAFDLYNETNTYLNEGLIRTNPVSSSLPVRCSWMPAFLDACGNPHRGIPTVHIAGTSGKGTTALMIAEILRSAGIRTGLHISPYLQVSTEKIWIDGNYVEACLYHRVVEAMKPVFECFRAPEIPIHGMASVAVALEVFRRANVEVIVFETGVGGRYDLTNFLDTTVAVITKIGLDHQKALGRTHREIAWHKAGIIKPGKPCIALASRGFKTIRNEATRQYSHLVPVKPGTTYRQKTTNDHGTLFDYHGPSWHFKDLFTVARGPFQVENAGLATATAELLAGQWLRVSEDAVREGLGRAALPGRIEIVQEDPRVILDGAHNPDKIENLLRFLAGNHSAKKKVLVCGILNTKMHRPFLSRLEQLTDRVITTPVRAYGKETLPAETLADIFRNQGIHHVTAIENNDAAMGEALRIAGPDGIVIGTGSLYLVGKLRNRWYTERDIVLQRTSFPGPRFNRAGCPQKRT